MSETDRLTDYYAPASAELTSDVCGIPVFSAGTNARMNSTSHCGRTTAPCTLAGITTASPHMNVTGSCPGDSMTPHPLVATRHCALPWALASNEFFSACLSTTNHGDAISAGAFAASTFPAYVFARTA